jgi:hypothetical protein
MVLLASPVKLRRFSSMTPEFGRPRPPLCNPTDGGGDVVRGSDEIELRFRLDMIELTLPPPRGGREPRGARMRDVVSPEVWRESEARLGFNGASSLWVTTGEPVRPGTKGEEELEGERTRGVPLRPGLLGRGEPLLRRLDVGGGGEALTGVEVRAGTGAVSGSDSGGGEVKAGLGGNSSSSGGGDLKAGRGGTLGFVASTGTGATNGGGSGTGLGFTSGGGVGGG